jgi:ketosteroid isomerase-like protein
VYKNAGDCSGVSCMDVNGDLALRFLQAFWRGDLAATSAMSTEDAVFVFARSLPYPRHCPLRDAHAQIVGGLFAAFDPPGRFEVTVRQVLTAGDAVTVEYSARGKLANGRDYENDYIMALTVRDGRIHEQRAYTDTAHLSRLFGP